LHIYQMISGSQRRLRRAKMFIGELQRLCYACRSMQ